MHVSFFVMWRFGSTGLPIVSISFQDINPTRPSTVSEHVVHIKK